MSWLTCSFLSCYKECCGLLLKPIVREAVLYGLGELYFTYSHRSGVTWIANQCLHMYFSHTVEDRFVPFLTCHLYSCCAAYVVTGLIQCDSHILCDRLYLL